MMKKDYANKSWIQEDLDAHWHEHEVDAYGKKGRLAIIASVLTGILISLVLLIVPMVKAGVVETTLTRYEVV